MKYIRKLNSKHFSTNSENSSFSTPFWHFESSSRTSGFKIQLRDFFFRIPHASKYPIPCWQNRGSQIFSKNLDNEAQDLERRHTIQKIDSFARSQNEDLRISIYIIFDAEFDEIH